MEVIRYLVPALESESFWKLFARFSKNPHQKFDGATKAQTFVLEA